MKNKIQPLTTNDQLRIISDKPKLSHIDWQTVAICSAIAIVGISTFAYIIVTHQESMQRQWQLAVNDSNLKFADVLKEQNQKLFTLTYEVRHSNSLLYNIKTSSNDKQNGEGINTAHENLEK